MANCRVESFAVFSKRDSDISLARCYTVTI